MEHKIGDSHLGRPSLYLSLYLLPGLTRPSLVEGLLTTPARLMLSPDAGREFRKKKRKLNLGAIYFYFVLKLLWQNIFYVRLHCYFMFTGCHDCSQETDLPSPPPTPTTTTPTPTTSLLAPPTPTPLQLPPLPSLLPTSTSPLAPLQLPPPPHLYQPTSISCITHLIRGCQGRLAVWSEAYQRALGLVVVVVVGMS